MIESMNQEMIKQNWKSVSTPLLEQAFLNYKPRADFYRKKPVPVTFPEKQNFNIVAYRNLDLPSFAETWKTIPNFDLLKSLFDQLHDSVLKLDCSFSFLTFSTNLLSTVQCPVHLHNFLNSQPCSTTTFGIPLYVHGRLPSFHISKKSQQWPLKCYLDFNRIPQDLEYESIQVQPDKILKIEFNSSFHPHFITYTESVVAWLVIDGADHQQDFFCKQIDFNSTQIGL